jgi:NADPH:quinone reductase-like Zn-dependent oxidoreductase
LPENGTLSQYITVPASKVYPKPGHLSLSEAAAIPLAGLTAYRAVLVKANIKAGENVLITGIGGGVATFAFLFSKAMGANIFVTSGSNEKIKTAKQLGAFEGFNYQNEMWDEVLINILNNKIDAAIDGTGGDVISKIMNVVKPGGRIVNYGATKGNANNFDMRKLFWKQIILYGTTMGSDKDFKNMMSFINKYKIKPMIDNIYEFEDYISAFERMNFSEQLGKIIIRI